MSELQAIAGKLRALAGEASPLTTELTAVARELTRAASAAESLRRSGAQVTPVVGAIQRAQRTAERAADAARQVKAEGKDWADHLARGGGGGGPIADAIETFQAIRDAPTPTKIMLGKAVALAFVKTAGGEVLDATVGRISGREELGEAAGQGFDAVIAGLDDGLIPYTQGTFRKLVGGHAKKGRR